jgi:hypothetical protein
MRRSFAIILAAFLVSPLLLRAQTMAAPGLPLPPDGNLWALDTFNSAPELVRMKFSEVNVDNHSGSNFARSQLFMKQKKSIVLDGPASATRLHPGVDTFYVRGFTFLDPEDSSTGTTSTHLAIVKLEVKDGHRIVSQMAFAQFSGNGKRSEDVVPVTLEKAGATGWFKMTATQPLASGEYAIVPIPKGQNQFATSVWDFAVDASAPEMPGALKPGI